MWVVDKNISIKGTTHYLGDKIEYAMFRAEALRRELVGGVGEKRVCFYTPCFSPTPSTTHHLGINYN